MSADLGRKASVDRSMSPRDRIVVSTGASAIAHPGSMILSKGSRATRVVYAETRLQPVL